jgi:hypothetical protein
MDEKTPTPVEKLAATVIEATEELLKAGGFVNRGGKWISADDLKADAL